MSTGIKFRRLAAATVAAAIGAAMVVNIAAAQAPPNPPSRFVGSVTVNGVAATTGTVIEGRVGGASCGTTTVFQASGQARYVLDVPAADPASAPGCGTDGATVTFFIGGQQAAQTGIWRNFQLNTVDLSVAAATQPPAATPTAAPTTPASTPRAPVVGNFDGSSTGSDAPMLEILLVAAAIGLGGVAVAARARRS